MGRHYGSIGETMGIEPTTNWLTANYSTAELGNTDRPITSISYWGLLSTADQTVYIQIMNHQIDKILAIRYISWDGDW